MTEEVKAETVSSVSDERTVNNVVRHEYRVLTDVEKAQVQTVKDIIRDFITTCSSFASSREISLAITKAEEAAMWAVKGLTK